MVFFSKLGEIFDIIRGLVEIVGKRMMKLKKTVKSLLAFLLVLCMVFSLSVLAFAEDEPATTPIEINAESSVLASGSYILNDNVTLSRGALTIAEDAEVIIDLNGYTLRNAANSHTIYNKGTLTINNEKEKDVAVEEQTGGVTNTASEKQTVYNEVGATATLNGGHFQKQESHGYVVLNHGTMATNAGVYMTTWEETHSSLFENGWQNGNQNTGKVLSELTINGGVYDGGLNTIKNDDFGKLVINDGTFKNITQAAVLNWNVTEINDGEFTLAEDASVQSVILNGQIDNTMDKGELTIKGGTFTASGTATAITTMENGQKSTGTITISGGSFTGDIEIKNSGSEAANSNITISKEANVTGNVTIAAGSATVSEGATVSGNVTNAGTGALMVKDASVGGTVAGNESGDTMVLNSTVGSADVGNDNVQYVDSKTTDGDPIENTADIIAVIGAVGYTSLQDAVNAAGTDETTIALIKSATGKGVVVEEGKKIIFDLGGNTYTVNEGVGSSGTETNGFQLLKNSNVTFKNGTIAADGKAAELYILIQNYSNLTLEEVTLDGRGLTNDAGDVEYTLSNNNGETALNAGTTIYARADGEIAMDVCWAKSYVDGAKVTVKDGATINGTVELGLWGQDAYADNQSVLTVNGGDINGELKLDKTITKDEVAETIETVKSNVAINGGTFAGNVDAYIDSETEAKAKVNSDGKHSYYPTVKDAVDAAKNGDTVTVFTEDAETPIVVSVNAVASVTSITIKDSNASLYYAVYDAQGANKIAGWTVGTGKDLSLGGLKSNTKYLVKASSDLNGDNDSPSTEAIIVEVEVTTRRISGSTGSGDGTVTTRYEITVADTENGQVVVSQNKATEDSIITVTITPNDGFVLDELTVKDEKGNVVSANKKAEDKWEFTMPDADVTVKATFISEEEAAKLPFTDLVEDAWYTKAITYVYENGLMNGVSATMFEPNESLTRGMLVQVLYNLEGKPVVTTNMFDDVAAEAWYSAAVNWAAEKAIVNGHGEGVFAPNDAITREQLAAILYRYATYKAYDTTASGNIDSFTDGNAAADWAQTALIWAADKGIMQGDEAGLLNPTGTATRAEVAQMLLNFSKMINE